MNNKIKAIIIILFFINLFPFFGQCQESNWKITSHLDDWNQFIQNASKYNKKSAVQMFYSFNPEFYNSVMKHLGIKRPKKYLYDHVKLLDLKKERKKVEKVISKEFTEIATSVISKIKSMYPGLEKRNINIHLINFFPLFDGMAMLLENEPAVILNCTNLVEATDFHIKVLIAHELNHALRFSFTGYPSGIHKGILHQRVRNSLILEGLAVAFSEITYPDGNLEDYIPFYRFNPDKLTIAKKNQDKIISLIIENLDKKISNPSVQDYFYGQGAEDMRSSFRNSAYFVGYRLIKILLEKGYNICELTAMPSKKIIKIYLNK
jgi:uncharacterized protein YjaZ